MIICQLCGNEFESINSLAKHLFHSHKEISKEEYYNTYIPCVDPFCECGKRKKFRGMGEGYRTFCSLKCSHMNDEIRRARSIAQKGKKQSPDTIRKRIENTDQILKQRTNQNTIMRRYGVSNVGELIATKEKTREKLTGQKRPRKNAEHQRRIVESKRRNNTLRHRESTKAKMSRALLSYSQTGNDQSSTMNKTPTNGRGHRIGFHNGVLYRSSYELIFILFCEKHGIVVESGENCIRRVRYVLDNKQHWYYPDFFLPEMDICVEIKPRSMMNDTFLVKKQFAEKVYRCYTVLSEDQLFDESSLYEHIFTRQKPDHCSTIPL